MVMYTFFINFYTANSSILSTINTAAHANNATVRRLFSLYAAISATINPTVAEITLSVAKRIAGYVMAARHAEGTYYRNDLITGLVISFLERASGSIRIRYVTAAITRM